MSTSSTSVRATKLTLSLRKVAIVLAELDLPHEIEDVQFADVKKPDFLKINPNGRMPAIHDPNRDLTLWESGAIIEYLVEVYDKKQKLSFPAGSNEAYLAKQWLYYQVSGQGPYFGQVSTATTILSNARFSGAHIMPRLSFS